MPRFRLALTACAVISSVAAAQQPALRVELIDTAVVTSERLGEASGIETSRRPGVYWLHNDSGDRPRLFAVDSAGHDLGGYRLRGAANRDWEALAAGPCVVVPGRCLYIGDIGDNARRRGAVVVYRVREPEPGGPDSVIPLLDSIVLRYPGDPHNAEGLAITRAGRLIVAVKDFGGPAQLYDAPADAREAVLAPRCSLDMRVEALTGRVLTGLDVSPGGEFLVIRTYVSLHVFRADGACTPLTGRSGIVIPVVESQGEAVAFEGSDRLVLVSERGPAGHAIITRLRIIGLP